MSLSLEGLYALEVVIAGFMEVPFLGEIQVLSRSLLSVEIEKVDTEYWQHQSVCFVESYDSTRLSETRIPPRFVTAIPPQRFPIVLQGSQISWDPAPVYLGFDGQLPLPNTLEDPKVRDSDQDGLPGVTVYLDIPLLGTVELYLVQYTDISMQGEFGVDGGRGQIDIEALAQETIGSSHMVFNRSNHLKPQAEQSYFWLRSMSENDCTHIRQAFPPMVPDWTR